MAALGARLGKNAAVSLAEQGSRRLAELLRAERQALEASYERACCISSIPVRLDLVDAPSSYFSSGTRKS